MTRVDELRKKYPSIPIEVIVKWEVLRNGVRDTTDFAKACHWVVSEATHYSYQTYDFDITLKDLKEKWPAWFKPNAYLRPTYMYMKNGIGVPPRLHTRSPYEFRDLGDGKLALFEGEERIPVDVYFPYAEPWKGPVPRTSKGNSILNFFNVDRRCFRIAPVRYCQYFDTGEQCKFCNYTPGHKDAASVGVGKSATINLEETVEAYKIASSELRLLEGRFEMGALRERESEAKIYADFVGKIASGASYHPPLCLHVQPLSRKAMQRLKDVGLDTISFQMEVWDRELFAEVCPGKAKYTGYDRYTEAFLEAVDIFGFGNVGGAFVAGSTMQPFIPNGHKTWQEARDSLIEGNSWMIKNGILATYQSLRPAPGSMYWVDKDDLNRYPPTDFYLQAGLAYDKACIEYGMFEKMNRFLWCGFDCLTFIWVGDAGMLAQAGDVGNWMAKCTPPELNWIAGFISSVKQNESTE